MEEEAVRWNIKVSKETDLTLRTSLGAIGMKKGDLSKFIEEALRWRVFHRTVQDIKSRNAVTDPTKGTALSLATTIGSARPQVPRRSRSSTRSTGSIASEFAGDSFGPPRCSIHSAEIPASSCWFNAKSGRSTISPHTLRHTKAMHLLQSGSPLVMVKDFLGHVDLKSTEVYVQADLEMKRKALELGTGPRPTQAPQLTLPFSLIEWLESL